MKKYALQILFASIGLIVGIEIGFDNVIYKTVQTLCEAHKWLYPVIGVLIGFFSTWIFSSLNNIAATFQVRELSIKTLAGTVKFDLQNYQKRYVWNIFVELSTRIATNSLRDTSTKEDTGSLKVALSSLYSLFTTVRKELQSMPPSPPPEGETATLESIVYPLLNEELRPFLSRWHVKLEKWEKTGLPEDECPLAALCRRDLETTTKQLRYSTYNLGNALQIPQLDKILGGSPPDDDEIKTLALVSIEEIEAVEKDLYSTEPTERKTVIWEIFVEMNAISTEDKTIASQEEASQIIENLSGLHQLIKEKLKSLPPLPKRVNPRQYPQAETLLLEFISKDLFPFLAKWEKQKADSRDLNALSQDIQTLFKKITEYSEQLKPIIGGKI